MVTPCDASVVTPCDASELQSTCRKVLSSNVNKVCCSCGKTGKCVRCSCVISKVPCRGCIPGRYGKCFNNRDINSNNGGNGNYKSRPGVSVSESVNINNDLDSDSVSVSSGSFAEEKIMKAYGQGLLLSDGGNKDNVWFRHWSTIVHLPVLSQYDLPSGRVGREFVVALSDEVLGLSRRREQSERLIVFMAVLLQRDNFVKKNSDIRRLLQRRLSLWKDSHFGELVAECVRCAGYKSKGRKSSKLQGDAHDCKVFTRLVLRGQMRSAVRWLTERCSSGGVLLPSAVVDGEGKTVLDVLKAKHPEPGLVQEEAFLDCDVLPVQIDVDITAEHVGKIAKRIQGGRGPGGTTAIQWQDFLLRFGHSSESLRNSIAELTRRLANNIVEWNDCRAIWACRLIGLDKCPGVRPIGIGEVLRRLMGKVMASVTGPDVEVMCGKDQLCSGLSAGIEGAIHSTRELFDEMSHDGFGLLLIDAKNAFNSLNRVAALWNTRILWPRASRFLFNSYRGFSFLVIGGHPGFILSKEGVIQGDPLSMLMYSVSILPLIHFLIDLKRWSQNWYADDSSCIADFASLKDWFSLLCQRGPGFGYFVEPTKSSLVVNSKFEMEAVNAFEDLGVRVVTSSRFLGGCVGDQAGVGDYLTQKVQVWESCVEKLAVAAALQPQAGYAALSKSLQFEWQFLQRVVPNCGDHFTPLGDRINNSFWPSLFGGGIDSIEKQLFSLPARMGGLGVRNPVDFAKLAFDTSRSCAAHLIDAVKGLSVFDISEHMQVIRNSKQSQSLQCRERDEQTFNSILGLVCDTKRRVIKRAVDWKTSGWLTIMPLSCHHFDLSPNEFRDALCLRYNRSLVRMPMLCDGCENPSSVQHALDCRKGGLVIKRHNEIRDILGDICSLVTKNVVKEPIVRDASDTESGLIADLGIRGLWEPQVDALVDITVVDTDARSYSNKSVQAVLSSAEQEKKAKYCNAAEFRRASFSPFVISVDGAPGHEADRLMKRLSESLALKWSTSYGEVLGWLRARMSCAVVRATNLCLRGSRIKWRNDFGFEDGAGLPQNYY